MPSKRSSVLAQWYVLLVGLECAFAIYAVALIPSDTRNAILFGYSASRLALLAIPGLLFLVCGSLFISIHRSASLQAGVDEFFNKLHSNRIVYLSVNLFSLGLLLLGLILFLLPVDEFRDSQALLERMAPVVYLGGVIGLETLVLMFVLGPSRFDWKELTYWKHHFLITGVILVLLGLVSIMIARTGVGWTPERYGWHSPGTPLLFSQLFLCWLAALPFVFWMDTLEKWYNNFRWRFRSFVTVDFLVCLILWLTAFVLWQNQPMLKESYFTPRPTPPNFEYYPYSDAAFYDQTSQILLIGEGRNNTVVLRPLYVFFLAVLHLVAGQQYEQMLIFQTLFLALMPALAFLTASQLGSRPAGIMAGLLIIFRERNSIALTDVIEVTHSKLLLSDVPTMALMMLTIFALLHWLTKDDDHNHLGIIAGASFGLMVLVRSQAQLLLPILLLGVIFSRRLQWQMVLQRTFVFLLGFVLVVSPWVWRNHQVSGHAVVENTEFYMRLFAGSYAEPGDSVDILPGESVDEYNARMRSQIVEYIMNHPFEVGRVYATYFLHNEIGAVVHLPLSLKLYGLRSYIANIPLWDSPSMKFEGGAAFILALNLAIAAMGIAVALHRAGFVGLMPLLLHFGYSFSIVPARLSGWRYILPVDWIVQLYYSIGLIQLTLILISLFHVTIPASKPDAAYVSESSGKMKKFAIALLLSLVVGLSLPTWELSIPQRFHPLSEVDLIHKYMPDSVLLESGQVISADALEAFLASDVNAKVLHGQALYPSYYESGKFWGDESLNLLAASQYDRLQFNLIPSGTFSYIPLEQPPEYFPHASDVFVVGCLQQTGLQVLLIKLDDQFLTSSSFTKLACSQIE